MRWDPAGEAAERFALAPGRKAARRKSLGGGRLGAGLARLVAEDRFGADRGIFRGADRLLVARFALQPGNDDAEKMRVEQRVEFGETLGRRCKGRASRATDIANLLRTEKLNRGEPGHGLLGGDGEARAPQQRGEAEEAGDRAGRVGHACASARMASILGAM